MFKKVGDKMSAIKKSSISLVFVLALLVSAIPVVACSHNEWTVTGYTAIDESYHYRNERCTHSEQQAYQSYEITGYTPVSYSSYYDYNGSYSKRVDYNKDPSYYSYSKSGRDEYASYMSKTSSKNDNYAAYERNVSSKSSYDYSGSMSSAKGSRVANTGISSASSSGRFTSAGVGKPSKY